MKVANGIKTLDRIGGSHTTDGHGMYATSYKGWEISFIANTSMDSVDAVYVRKNGVDDEPQSDYYAGTFAKSLNAARNMVDRIAEVA